MDWYSDMRDPVSPEERAKSGRVLAAHLATVEVIAKLDLDVAEAQIALAMTVAAVYDKGGRRLGELPYSIEYLAGRFVDGVVDYYGQLQFAGVPLASGATQ